MSVTFHCEGVDCTATGATTPAQIGVRRVSLPEGWEWRPAPGASKPLRLYCPECLELQDSAARELTVWLRQTNCRGPRGQA